MDKERKALDLQTLAKDEEAIGEIATELEEGPRKGTAKLWTEEFSASGEKNVM
jgi:hypothetical protein